MGEEPEAQSPQGDSAPVLANTERKPMTASPEGCGVLDHISTCLCDVIIPHTIDDNYARIPYGHINGEAIAHFGKWDGTIVHWLELVDKANVGLYERRNDLVLEHRRNEQTGQIFRTMPDEIYEYLVDGIRVGKQPTPLKNEIQARFDYTISKSYVTKLRQRLEKRGLL